MEFTIEAKISLKPGVLDAEGETVKKSLGLLGYEVSGVETVKDYRVTVDAKNESEALELVGSMCEKLLANPVIQDYELSVV